jgi:hypothetical protein
MSTWNPGYTVPEPNPDGAEDQAGSSDGGGGAVSSVNGQTGVVVLDADDVGAVGSTVLAETVGEGAAGISSIGLRPDSTVAPELATWLTAYANRATTDVDIVVVGDSLSQISSPSTTGQQPWAARLARLLGETGPGWRGAYPNVDAPTATASTGTATQLATGGFGSTLDVGEYSSFVLTSAAVAKVVWTRTPGGGDLEVRYSTVGGTLVATIDTDGAQKSGMVTEVAIPAAVFGGTIFVVASGATATLDGVLFEVGSQVHVYNSARGGITTLNYTQAPSRGLDLIENVDPDIVITALGTNDDTANIAARTTTLLSEIRSRTAALVVMVIPPVSSGFAEADAALLRGVAVADGNVLVIDMSTILPDYGVTAGLSGDLLHPTELTHMLWAEVVAGVLLGDPIGHAYRASTHALFAETAARAAVLTSNGKGFVNHGSTAGTARPTGFASIEWYGTVTPSNAIVGDTWVNPS